MRTRSFHLLKPAPGKDKDEPAVNRARRVAGRIGMRLNPGYNTHPCSCLDPAVARTGTSGTFPAIFEEFPMRVSGLLSWPVLDTLALAAPPVAGDDEVNLYTTREPGLIPPLLDAFSKDTGIKVNTVFVADGLLERVRAEGERSPADVLMTVDSGNLLDLVDNGVTQGIESQT